MTTTTNNTFNAQTATFGVEIETVPTHSGHGNDTGWHPAAGVGGYHRGIELSEFRGTAAEGWKAERDSSLGYGGIEFISPVLSGYSGLNSIGFACEWFRDNGRKVDNNCGVHIHIGIPGNDMRVIQRLVRLVAHFEKALYGMTGTTYRESCGYTRSIKNGTVRHETETKEWKKKKNMRDLDYCGFERMATLNLTNIISGRRPAVEFRVFSPSLNASKIAAWVQVCLALVEAAHAETRIRDMDYTPTAKYAKGTTGIAHATLNYFFAAMGWTKGAIETTRGDLRHESYSIADSKKILRRLCKKYDSRSNG